MQRSVPESRALESGTLGAALRATANRLLPARFAQVLQAAFPLALQAWTWGWHRTAGWLVVLGTFGLWALCEGRLARATDWSAAGFESSRWERVTLEGARRLAAVAAALLALLLVSEAFLQLMWRVSGCAGCAG